MVYSNGKLAGVLFFIAAAQFILGLIVAEALYPGYNISNNYISDLGVGSSSTIFNVSVFFLGLLSIIATYFLQRAFHFKVLTILLAVSAVAAMGVGLFTENSALIHYIASVLVFLFGALSAIFSYRLMKRPLTIIVVLLGVLSLSAMALFLGNTDLGLGVGGMERMIVYPILIWLEGFGAFLITNPEQS